MRERAEKIFLDKMSFISIHNTQENAVYFLCKKYPFFTIQKCTGTL